MVSYRRDGGCVRLISITLAENTCRDKLLQQSVIKAAYKLDKHINLFIVCNSHCDMIAKRNKLTGEKQIRLRAILCVARLHAQRSNTCFNNQPRKRKISIV